MLAIIERELVRKYYFMIRPFQLSGRRNAFAKSEHAGTDLSGSWADSETQKRDAHAYTDATDIHSFVDFHQSKGSHVVDVNGNVLLDLCSTESRPLGHNHEAFTGVSINSCLSKLLPIENHQQQSSRLLTYQLQPGLIRETIP